MVSFYFKINQFQDLKILIVKIIKKSEKFVVVWQLIS